MFGAVQRETRRQIVHLNEKILKDQNVLFQKNITNMQLSNILFRKCQKGGILI